jgi:hypothetical protein
MLDCCGGKHRIDHGRRLPDKTLRLTADRAPAPHDRIRQRENPAGEPSLQRGDAGGDPGAKRVDRQQMMQTLVVFAERQDAEEL